MARRTRGEGTIYQTTTGNWRAQLVVDGRRVSCSRKTARECREWLREQQEKKRKGISASAHEITLNEFLDDWLVSISTRNREWSCTNYKVTLRKYIRPSLGDKRLSDLKPFLIQGVIDKLIRDGAPPPSVSYAFRTLKTALAHAVKLNALGYNPCDGVMAPKRKKPDIVVYDDVQVQQYVLACDELRSPNRVLYKLAVGTGMRLGEILGLKWKDVNWGGQQITIIRQRASNPKSKELVTLKTKSSERTIQVPGVIVDQLSQHRELQWTRRKGYREWEDRDIIFASTKGQPLSRGGVRNGHNRIIEIAGLPRIRFHDLRHTAISLMLQRGVPVIEVSKYVGHANATITLGTYGHFIPSKHSQAAMAMEDILTPVAVDL